MITTVTLNAAVDKTYRVAKLAHGRVTRIPEMAVYPGGKGINVARVVKQLGCEVTATGFAGGYNGAYIRSALTAQGIAHDFTEVPGESRLALNLLHDDGTSTELLEPGPVVAEEHVADLERKLAAWAERSKIVIISGSAPTGVPIHIYARWVAMVKAAGAQAFLDASGLLLSEGVKAVPDLIKPNEEEFVALAPTIALDDGEESRAAAVRALTGRAAGMVALTLGGDGSLIGSEGAMYRVRVPKLRVVSTVGCGDAFVAGMAAGTMRQLPMEDRIRLAAAAACANALHREAGRIDSMELERLLPQIDIISLK